MLSGMNWKFCRLQLVGVIGLGNDIVVFFKFMSKVQEFCFYEYCLVGG